MVHSEKKRTTRKTHHESGLTLTPRQIQILRMVYEYRNSNGCSPTMQEMAHRLKVNRVTIFEHVETLVGKGLLCRVPNKARSLTLNAEYDLAELVGQADPEASFSSGRDADSSVYPLAGEIAAGLPIEAIENQDTLSLPELFSSSGTTFALRVRGDSMIEEQIRDGDYVLVQKSSHARDGEIVVALLEDGDATLKTIYRRDDGYVLQPAYPAFEPIFVKSVQIQGVVIGVVRRL